MGERVFAGAEILKDSCITKAHCSAGDNSQGAAGTQCSVHVTEQVRECPFQVTRLVHTSSRKLSCFLLLPGGRSGLRFFFAGWLFWKSSLHLPLMVWELSAFMFYSAREEPGEPDQFSEFPEAILGHLLPVLMSLIVVWNVSTDPSSTMLWFLAGLILCRPCASIHLCYEFMCAMDSHI